jgi:signal peptidase II
VQTQGGAPVLNRRGLAKLFGPTGPITLAGTVFLVDQLSKWWARAHLASNDISVIDGLLSLRLIYNTGAVFGVLRGGRWFFLALSPPVAVVLLAWSLRTSSLYERISAGLVLGGLAGNSWDRLMAPAGRVTDFIDLSFWPAFNVADAAMVVGLAIYAVLHLVRRRKADAFPERPGA